MNIAKTLRTEIALSRNAETALLIAVFSALSFAGAMVRIYTPISPVPFTLQTFFLYISVFYLGSRNSGLAQAIYIVAGLFGAPVFAAGLSGAIAVTGPTAGYLAGFVVSAVLMSYVLRNMKNTGFIFLSGLFLAGAAILLSLGAAHLALVYKMPVAAAINQGLIAFIPAEIIKATAAAAILQGRTARP